MAATNTAGTRAGRGPPELCLRAYELIEPRYRFASGDRYVGCVHLAPLNSELIAGHGEDPADVLRGIGEGVARIGVGPAAHEDPVGRATAIGVNEASNQKSGIPLGQPSLPPGQLDEPLMLEPRSVLGKKTRPLSRVGADLCEPLPTRPPVNAHPVARHHPGHRSAALLDDGRVLHVQADRQTKDTLGVAADVAVPEVHAQ